MKDYHLGFISNEDIYNHVKETVESYRTYIDLNGFNDNIIDPIKLIFDAKIYGKTFEEIIESECIRQIDKTNTNCIGYFHQNLFKYAGNGWDVPDTGFDVVNKERHIYAMLNDNPDKIRIKKKRCIIIQMFDKLLHDDMSVCLMVNTSDCSSKDEAWKMNVEGEQYINEKIRYVSIDVFYGIVFAKENAYDIICEKLPIILSELN